MEVAGCVLWPKIPRRENQNFLSWQILSRSFTSNSVTFMEASESSESRLSHWSQAEATEGSHTP